ncbi:MAG: selenide, water dikinase SelD [Prolixibacteraceae bacterium]|nr:selenide, water dikinase SelD [Prolixibacteraceae bacterium]
MEEIRLTQFSSGAGCGCKIAPRELEIILHHDLAQTHFPDLLVGNESRDDAAVYDIGNGYAVLSTTDFFTPIVDNAHDFGRIAAANAINDVYAMGGFPLMAIAILGWPLNKLPPELAREVVTGARNTCASAKIPLAGGHSVNIDTPIFGLAVTGMIRIDHLKKNCTAKAGCRVFLTKPLGVGIVTTAGKHNAVKPEDASEALRLMTTLNAAGSDFATLNGVRAMTDVTGFGLLGHALEIAEGSGVQIVLEYSKIPCIAGIAGIDVYIEQGYIPGGTMRNWNSYSHKVSINRVNEDREKVKALMCDPQTGGGLLVAVDEDAVDDLYQATQKTGTPIFEVGYVTEHKREDAWVSVV